MNDRSEAIPRAIKWLMAMHGAAAREALDCGFFGSLDSDEYALLPDQGDLVYEEYASFMWTGLTSHYRHWMIERRVRRFKRRKD